MNNITLTSCRLLLLQVAALRFESKPWLLAEKKERKKEREREREGEGERERERERERVSE